MKLILLLLTLSLLFVSCSNEKKSPQNKDSISKSENTFTIKGPTVELKYKFNKGDKFSYKLSTRSNSTEEIIADTTIINNIIQNASYKMDFKVKSVDDYNTANIQVKISSIIAETDLNGQKLKYDSKFIYSTREKVQFVDYEAVKNVPFNIKVSELGQVISVENVEKIMKNILEIQKVPDTLSKESINRMKMNIENGTLMPLTQQIFKVVPDNEVGKDSTWQLKYTTPLAVFNVENTAVFKINSLDLETDSTATISSTLLFAVTGKNVVTENGITYSFAQPKLDAIGKIEYSTSKGLVLLSESNTSIEISMIMDGKDNSNNLIQSTKKDISNNTNVVELLNSSF